MALKTTLEQLEEVQAAITRILTAGQEQSFVDGGVREAQLAALEAREKRLIDQYAREQGTGGLTRNTGILKRPY